jgi:hypothetical protein
VLVSDGKVGPPGAARLREPQGEPGLQCRLLGCSVHERHLAIVVLVTTFLALLATLVGEELSLSVLVEVWAEGDDDVTRRKPRQELVDRRSLRQ